MQTPEPRRVSAADESLIAQFRHNLHQSGPAAPSRTLLQWWRRRIPVMRSDELRVLAFRLLELLEQAP